MFRLMNPSALFAFEVTVAMCLFQLRSGVSDSKIFGGFDIFRAGIVAIVVLRAVTTYTDQ